MTVSIIDYQTETNLTGFEFNLPTVKGTEVKTMYGMIPETVQAARLKVDKLTRLDLFVNNFISIDERELVDQQIARFRGDVRLAVYIADDTKFATKVNLNEASPDADLAAAGFFKLADFRFNETAESNVINVSQDYDMRSASVDLDAIKTEKAINTAEVTLVIFTVVSGALVALNVDKTTDIQAIFNFNLRGSRFFFNKQISDNDFKLLRNGFAALTWKIHPFNTDSNWKSICFGAGNFIGVGSSGTNRIVKSINKAVTFTLSAAPVDNNWNSVCFGNNLFVAVANSGTGNRVMTSPDGSAWAARNSAADNNWTSVCFGNNLFVAVANSGTGNRVMTSPNGIDWTLRNSAGDKNWSSVCFGKNLFVAVAETGEIMTSPNGIDWTLRNNPGTLSPFMRLKSVCFGNNLFVAVAGVDYYNFLLTSDDGITWQKIYFSEPACLNSVVYGNGIYVAVGGVGDNSMQRILISRDGKKWNIYKSESVDVWNSVCFGSNLFVAIAGSGQPNKIMISQILEAL